MYEVRTSLLAAVLVVLLAGCAAGRVAANGELYGVAFGHSKIELCERATQGTRPVCRRIQGGTLSTGASEFLGNVINGLIAWFAA